MWIMFTVTVPSHKCVCACVRVCVGACVHACMHVNVQFYSFSMLLWLYRNIQQLNLFAMTMLHDTIGDA